MEKDGDAIYRDYVSKVTTLVNRLLASGRQVRLLIGDKGDIEAARDILEQLAPAEANKVAFEPSASLHELMQQIARTDVVIASRYHNIVCALAMGRPTISTAYAIKNDALLHDTGLAAFCHRIDSFDPETILSRGRLCFRASNDIDHAGESRCGALSQPAGTTGRASSHHISRQCQEYG